VQLLTFQVGPHLFALPAATVLSVGRQGAEADGAGPAAATLDLGELVDPAGRREGPRPVIRYRDGARTVELLVDRILALEHCAAGTVRPWPGLLRRLALFTGVALIGGRLFHLLDTAALKPRGKGRRR